MAKKEKGPGFQQSAGLIRYFDAEEETAIHIDPRIVAVATLTVAIGVLVLNITQPF